MLGHGCQALPLFTQMTTQTLNFVWKPARSWVYSEGRPSSIKAIILHDTRGHKAGDISTLLGYTERCVSCHWYVTRKGELYHFVQDDDVAYHAGLTFKPSLQGNSVSVGIEMEHMYGEGWPDAQLRKTAQLIAFERQKHGSKLPVFSHATVAKPKGRKDDPEHFNWRKLSEYVKLYSQVVWTARKSNGA